MIKMLVACITLNLTACTLDDKAKELWERTYAEVQKLIAKIPDPEDRCPQHENIQACYMDNQCKWDDVCTAR